MNKNTVNSDINHHNKRDGYDVIIIGAGISGLTAGQGLQKDCPDISLVVLEARDRIGGRIWTTTTTTTTIPHDCTGKLNDSSLAATTASGADTATTSLVDMGATWIHGDKDNPIAKMARKLRIKLVEDPEEDVVIMDESGNQYPKKVRRNKEKDFWKLIRQSKSRARSSSSNPRMSVKTAMEKINPQALNDPIMNFLIQHNLEFDYGGSIEVINGADFDEDEEFRGEDAIPIGGYKSIVEHIAHGLTIHTGVVVHDVQYDEMGAKIQTSQGEYRAKKVICTLPLGVLKNGNVKFHPQLSHSKMVAINRLGLGTVVKVVMCFDKIFWPKDIKGFGLASMKHSFFYFINKFPFTGERILEGYCAGKSAIEMESRTKDQIISDALDSVSAMFQSEVVSREYVEKSLVQALVSDWGRDEYTFGAYSFCAVETQEQDFYSFLSSERGTLFFAGEHTSFEYRGGAHGAYISGCRVARQVAKCM